MCADVAELLRGYGALHTVITREVLGSLAAARRPVGQQQGLAGDADRVQQDHDQAFVRFPEKLLVVIAGREPLYPAFQRFKLSRSSRRHLSSEYAAQV